LVFGLSSFFFYPADPLVFFFPHAKLNLYKEASVHIDSMLFHYLGSDNFKARCPRSD
jgi:hypothetical protein